MIDMSKRPGRRVEGRNYDNALADILPGMISDKAMTKREIEVAAGRNHSTVTRVIEMHRDQMHIAEWRRGRSGPITPAWKWGAGEDAPRPDPIPLSERSAKYKASEKGKATAKKCGRRWRNSANGKKRTRAAANARYNRKRFEKGGVNALIKGDPLMRALFGYVQTVEKAA